MSFNKNKFKPIFKWIILTISVVLLIFILSFRTTIGLLITLTSSSLPNTTHITRIRSHLLNQESFLELLCSHEEKVLKSYKTSNIQEGLSKYIFKTTTGMFGLKYFNDYWEVWVRTDIINDTPRSSFLVRLGMIKDTNAVDFFSNQSKTSLGNFFWKRAIITYNKFFDLGIFKPIRLNITESPKTSSVSRVRLSLEDWNQSSKVLHKKGGGINFSKRFGNVK